MPSNIRSFASFLILILSGLSAQERKPHISSFIEYHVSNQVIVRQLHQLEPALGHLCAHFDFPVIRLLASVSENFRRRRMSRPEEATSVDLSRIIFEELFRIAFVWQPSSQQAAPLTQATAAIKREATAAVRLPINFIS